MFKNYFDLHFTQQKNKKKNFKTLYSVYTSNKKTAGLSVWNIKGKKKNNNIVSFYFY